MKFQNIDALQLKRWLDNEDAILIDVREPAEFSTKHIRGATLLPLGKITSSDLPKTEQKVVIYCQKGARGNSACVKVTDQDETVTVYNLMGGIEAWQNAGFDTQIGESKNLPLERQVQMTIGSFVLIGSLAAFFVDPTFVAIPAFFGAGLLFAGASGKCNLSMIMAKLPWNK
jgi:rhodanese-related sulfurtransferase